MRYLTPCLLLVLCGPVQARDYRAEARAAIALSLALVQAPAPAPAPTARTCPCSADCSCPCRSGGVCTCPPPTIGPVLRSGHVVAPSYYPQPYFSRPAPQAYQPQTSRPAFAPAFRGSGGVRCSG